MSYRIAQDYDYLGNQRWRWRTWIEAPEPELDTVTTVTWFLHHTFSDPVIVKRNRSKKFLIERLGWGMFEIRAEVRTKDGTTHALHHWLELDYLSGAEAATKGAGPLRSGPNKSDIFLSYGAEDELLASNIKRQLEDRGYSVHDPKQVEAGVPLEAAVRKMLRESDVILGLITSEYTSPSVLNELKQASQSHKPTIALVDRGIDQPFGLESSTNRVELDLKSADAGQEVADLFGLGL